MEQLTNGTVDIQAVKEVAFAIFGLITLFSAGYVLFTKNLLYGAYSLMLSFLGMAGMYVFAGADFLAVTQIMVYVGGILVLLIFAIMLTYRHREDDGIPNKLQSSPKRLVAGLGLGIVLFMSLAKMVFDTHIEHTEQVLPDTTVKKIGLELITNNLLVFEIVGVLLLVALIGAAHIAKKD